MFSKSSSRRQWLQSTGALGLAATSSVVSFAQDSSSNLPPHVPSWSKSLGKPFLSPAYGVPSIHEQHVKRALLPNPGPYPTASRTPLQFLHGTITPNGLVFERHHAGFPTIPPDEHRLMLHGMVDRPLIFTMEDIMRFPSESKIYFLECSGNSALELKKPTGITAQDTHGLLSCCEWTGVRLSTILQEAGIHQQATWLLAEGADAASMTRSIPMAKALDDAMLVYAQNGEMLRPEQGYPLRLFLPGFEGNMSVKWLRRLKLGNAPWQSREETSAYTDLMPDGTALQFTFHMEVKSVITSPSGGQTLKQTGFHEIQGLAWSGRGKIRKVEVSLDAGKHWQEAILQQPIQSKALVRFRLPWQWTGQPALLQSRATDEFGHVQPSRLQIVADKGINFYYHNNAIQTWQVSAQGEVRNVHA